MVIHKKSPPVWHAGALGSANVDGEKTRQGKTLGENGLLCRLPAEILWDQPLTTQGIAGYLLSS